MAVITTLFSKLRQMISTYVLGGNGNFHIFNTHYMYLMPIMYVGALGCVALFGYFMWKQYRSEVLQKSIRSNENALQSPSQLPPYTWLNRLVNWTFMTDPHKNQPECITRWVEDLNISLANQKTNIAVLLYDISDESFPPRVKDIGIVIHRSDGVMELPVSLESCRFGFQVSVQEHFDDKVVASSYEATVIKGVCMVNACLSRQNNNVIAKFVPDLNHHGNDLQIKMRCTSKQKIVSTIPETIANMVKDAMLTTPFQLNVTTWGGVFHPKKPKKSPKAKPKKETPKVKADKEVKKKTTTKEDATTPKAKETPPHQPGKADSVIVKKEEDKSNNKYETITEQNDKAATTTASVIPKRERSDTLEKLIQSDIPTAGLSGSLGSLVYVKRSNSGRGPPKPIRVREKQLIVKEISATLQKKDITNAFISAELDFPPQNRETKPQEKLQWTDDNLTFDLSSRSMEITLNLLAKNPDDLIAHGIFKLDGVNVHKPGEFSVNLLDGAGHEIGTLTIKISFVENVGDAKQKAKDRRSLDLSSLSAYDPTGFKASVAEAPTKLSNKIEKKEDPETKDNSNDNGESNKDNENGKSPLSQEKPTDTTNVEQPIEHKPVASENIETNLNKNVTLEKPPLSPRDRALTEVSKSTSKVPLRKQNKDKDWPRVHRSRSLIFGKGKKKEQHSQSELDLRKYTDEVADDDQDIPENSLQKNASAKKKSRSVTKLVSKIARKASLKKKKNPNTEEDEDVRLNGNGDANNSNINGSLSIEYSPKSDAASLASSFNDSSDTSMTLSPGGSSVKRSKSLRQRLFGAKRKNTKN